MIILNTHSKRIRLLFFIYFFFVNYAFTQNNKGKYFNSELREEYNIINDTTLLYSIYKDDTNKILKCYFDLNEKGLLNIKSFEKEKFQIIKGLYKKDSLEEIKDFYYGNSSEGWYKDVQGIFLYKNNIEVAFSYNSDILFQNLDSSYSFSIRSIDTFLGYKIKFQINDFQGNGKNLFIETEVGSEIIHSNRPNSYEINLYKELKEKQIYLMNDTIEVHNVVIIKNSFLKR